MNDHLLHSIVAIATFFAGLVMIANGLVIGLVLITIGVLIWIDHNNTNKPTT